MSDLALWIALAVTLAATGAWLVRPLLRRGAVEMTEYDQALSIYRDQIDEVRRDAAEGMIDSEAGEEAEREIAHRAARAARTAEAGLSVSQRQGGLAAATIGGVAAVTLGLYLALGAPDRPDQPLEARLEQMEQRLAAARQEAEAEKAETAEEVAGGGEDTFEYWWVRGRQASASGDHAAAAEAYRRAAALSDDAPSVVGAYAESLTLANGNKVPPPARLAFEQVLSREPKDPRARYYVALAKAQAKEFQAAMDDWLALLNDSAPDAPWIPLVRRDIANMAKFLEIDVASVLPDAPAAPAAEAPADDWRAAIARAEQLSGAGDADSARAALDAAVAKYDGAPFVQQQLADARARLGLADAATRGPTEDQIAAAGALSQEEQSEMIRGMVDGLAARLAEDGGNLDNWLMLIRSYAVLQDRARATDAVRSALQTFAADPAAKREVVALAAEFGLDVE